MTIPQSVRAVLETLERGGYKAYCVGGCVRDALLGRPPDDWDVATDALPEAVLSLFAPHAFPTGLQHGTVTVRRNHQSVEITTFRTDGAYTDRRHPDSVTFTPSLEEDLARRDLTVNAMALDLRGAVCDPFGGQKDLAARRLRCVGNADARFREDALRILRALRFAATLSFSLEEETDAALRRNRGLLREIAVERVWEELRKLLCGDAAAEVLRAHADVIGVFWPEAEAMVGFDQRNPHHIYDVWEHSLHALEATESDAVLRCAALLHDVGKPRTFTLDERGVGHFYGHGPVGRDCADEMLRRLRVSNGFREAVVTLVDWHDRPIPCTERGVRRALNRLGEEQLRRLIALKRADNLAQSPAYRSRQKELDEGEAIMEKLIAEDACFSLRSLAVNGRDLTALGFRGRAVGEALQTLLDAVIDGTLPNEKDALLHRARELSR